MIEHGGIRSLTVVDNWCGSVEGSGVDNGWGSDDGVVCGVSDGGRVSNRQGCGSEDGGSGHDGGGVHDGGCSQKSGVGNSQGGEESKSDELRKKENIKM